MVAQDNLQLAVDTMRSGVYIVTSAYRRKPSGCTCVWVNRVSYDPPIMVVSLAPSRTTLHTIEQGRRFCINVLGERDGMQLARHFGTASEEEVNRFDELEYKTGEGGSPVLKDAISYVDCKLREVIPVGDHRMVLGEVVDATVVTQERPLVYNPEAFYRSSGMSRSNAGETQA